MSKKIQEVSTKDHSEVLSTLTTTSSKIRYLDSQGLKRGEISKLLGVRYQWVRNVLITPLKKS